MRKKYEMDSHFHLEAEQNLLNFEIIMISGDEEETFSDVVSIVSSEFEESMMDVEAASYEYRRPTIDTRSC